jgi:outer membrane lipoprotein-sorting protein
MHRRTLLLAPLILLPLPAAAAPIGLAELSRYINAIDTAKADFTQVNADGTVATGRIFIRRPGRARFEYDGRDAALVLASAGSVAIFDPKSNQPPEQYPLKRTPLNLILARQVDLGRAGMVVGHREVENTTRVVAQDPENPEYGTIELVFTRDPLALRQWVITDDAGNQTTVILGELLAGGSLPGSLFDIGAEADRRGLQR